MWLSRKIIDYTGRQHGEKSSRAAKGSEPFSWLSCGLFKAHPKPREDTARANQRFSSAFPALNGIERVH